MSKRKFMLALSAIFVFAGPAQSQPASTAGLWVTEGGWATVRIGPCPNRSDRVCGWIMQLKEPNDARGRPKRDTANADPTLRGRPFAGMPFITGFRAAGPGRWTGGRIYNPGDGKTYASNLSLNPNGTLRVNGCVLMFCQSQTWTRTRA